MQLRCSVHSITLISSLPFVYLFIYSFHFIFLVFQPGENKSVKLVSIGGKRVIRGGNAIVDGPVDDAKWEEVLEALSARGFGNKEEENARFRLSTLQFSITCFPFLLL